MAKQESSVHLRGRIGGIVFYKSGEGYGARGAGDLDRERVMTDPKFANSRRAMTAFGRATGCGKLLSVGMGPLAKQLRETRFTGQLNKVMYDVLKSDGSVMDLDEKQVYRGDLRLLKGLKWHREKSLLGVLKADYSVNTERSAGTMSIQVSAFVPKRALKAPGGASHFEVFASGAAVDFEKGTIIPGSASSGKLPINGSSTGVIDLECSVSGGKKPVVVGLGVAFYQEVGGEMKLLVENSCFEIVGVGV